MPPFTLRWANRSNPGTGQTWQIGGAITDAFQLAADFVRQANVVINNDNTFQIAVFTDGSHFAAANVTYTANTQAWTLNSNTPNEFQLQTGGGIVTVRCLLNDAAAEKLRYSAMSPSKAVDG